MGAARDLHHSYGDGDGELTRAGKQHQKQRVRDRSIWRQQHSTGLTTTSNSNFDTELTLSWVSTAVKESSAGFLAQGFMQVLRYAELHAYV